MSDPRWYLTPGRRAWLLKLRDSVGPVRRGQGPVGHHCMEAGWTEWAYFDPVTGERIGNERAALARLGDKAALRHLVRGEMLTAAGYAALEGFVVRIGGAPADRQSLPPFMRCAYMPAARAPAFD
jgi:hypothetical protein